MELTYLVGTEDGHSYDLLSMQGCKSGFITYKAICDLAKFCVENVHLVMHHCQDL